MRASFANKCLPVKYVMSPASHRTVRAWLLVKMLWCLCWSCYYFNLPFKASQSQQPAIKNTAVRSNWRSFFTPGGLICGVLFWLHIIIMCPERYYGYWSGLLWRWSALLSSTVKKLSGIFIFLLMQHHIQFNQCGWDDLELLSTTLR